MRFLDVKTDYAFKRVFGSEGSKPVLVSFLNAILDCPKEEVGPAFRNDAMFVAQTERIYPAGRKTIQGIIDGCGGILLSSKQFGIPRIDADPVERSLLSNPHL